MLRSTIVSTYVATKLYSFWPVMLANTFCFPRFVIVFTWGFIEVFDNSEPGCCATKQEANRNRIETGFDTREREC